MAIATPTTAIQYPSGDGKPMAETWLHVRAIMWLHQALEDFFQNRPDVFIASDIFWYWEEGNPSARIAPDVMVVPGVQPCDPRERRSFFSWKEHGAVPAVVFEMASRGTVNEDLGEKFWKYEELDVREYFLFDPEAAHLVPVLQGFRLNGDSYRRIIPMNDELESELGFRLRVEGTMLRVLDTRTGRPIPTRAEAVEAERDRADTEKLRADALESEVERLKALLHKYGEPNGSGT
jgi:Uma2 family endonuclease